MDSAVGAWIDEIPLFRRLSAEDRRLLAGAARLRTFRREEPLFREGDPPESFLTIATGRVKVSKTTPGGRAVILELFGPGDPLGAVAVYEERPYPATAIALEATTCVELPRGRFFDLLDRRPSLVRGLLAALNLRLVELTRRLAAQTAHGVETRLARMLLKLADELGRTEEGGVTRIPLALSRRDLAQLTGTTVETAIRIMSRWGREGVVETLDGGFVLRDRPALERAAGEAQPGGG